MASIKRRDGRRANELRPLRLQTGFVPPADGSCLIEVGDTRVICTASIVRGAPEWLSGSGQGWVTAEYGMLPASTGSRKRRPIGKPDSRATEIQRLIGRALRSVVAMDRLGDNTIHLDCDVLTADGGTRTASITGAYVALAQAIAAGQERGLFAAKRILGAPIAAVSVGILDGAALLDMDYQEDSAAEVDLNVAMTAGGKFVELQGTAEGKPFDAKQLQKMVSLARNGIRKLIAAQRRAIVELRRERQP